MRFAEWLQDQLNKRGWTHSDLANSIRQSGYKISRSQITHIINQDRNASGDVCVAIAHGLGLPREEVFKARGWLLSKPQNVVPPGATPKASELIRALTALPDQTQEKLSGALFGVLEAVSEVTQKNDSEYPQSASEPIPENPIEPSDEAILSMLAPEYRNAVELLREHDPEDYKTLIWKLRQGVQDVLEKEHKTDRVSA